MHNFRLCAFSVLLSSVVAAQQTVDFFYSVTNNTCQYAGNRIIANQELTHGGVCAYMPSTGRTYACPAPDPTCWTWYETPASAGNCNDQAQVTCNRGGTVWCCNAVAGETCTTTSGQINICISNFTSPNNGVSIASANAKYQAAIGTAGSSITATSQSIQPTPFSTLGGTTKSTTSSSSSSSSSTMVSSTTSNTAAAASTSTSTASSSSDHDHPTKSSGIGAGAIAGIVIAVIAVLALVGAIFYIMGRRRRRGGQSQRVPREDSQSPAPGYRDSPNVVAPSAYVQNHTSNEKLKTGGFYGQSEKGGNVPMTELPSTGHGRAEMAGGADAPTRYEMA